MITPGQAFDKAAVPDLAGLPAAAALVADRGYDSMAIVALVKNLGGEAHIPNQSPVRIGDWRAPAGRRSFGLNAAAGRTRRRG